MEISHSSIHSFNSYHLSCLTILPKFYVQLQLYHSNQSPQFHLTPRVCMSLRLKLPLHQLALPLVLNNDCILSINIYTFLSMDANPNFPSINLLCLSCSTMTASSPSTSTPSFPWTPTQTSPRTTPSSRPTSCRRRP
jgi:hypothetical protein